MTAPGRTAASRSDHQCCDGAGARCFPAIGQSGTVLTLQASPERPGWTRRPLRLNGARRTLVPNDEAGPAGGGGCYPCVCRSQRGVRAA